MLDEKNKPCGFYSLNAFFMEIWLTFLFNSIFLIVTHKNTRTSDIGAIDIGIITMGLYLGILLTGPVSGACLNPAVGFGVNVMGSVFFKADTLKFLWIYLAGPWTGAILAGLFWGCF